MRLISLFLAAVSALNCSEYGLEAFDKVNVVTGIFSTPPLKTNRTVYFNPCSPLQGVPECGADHHMCTIEKAEIHGEWVTTAIKHMGKPDPGHIVTGLPIIDDGFMAVHYRWSYWGDFATLAGIDFQCSNETSIHLGYKVDNGDNDTVTYGHRSILDTKVTINTPQACGFKYQDWPDDRRSKLWSLIWYTMLFVGISLLAYVGLAIFVSSQSRQLGPLSQEALGALRELPLLLRESALALYERLTGRGTGRNTI